MLTILFLIYRLFYFTPGKSQNSSISDVSGDKKESTGSVSKTYESVRGESAQVGSVCKETVRVLRESSKVYTTELAIVAICRISTSSVQVPEEESNVTTTTMSIEEKFKAAVRVIHSLPKDGPYQPANSTKLKFYGLYKQATEGKNSTPKPGFWDVIGRAKWEAWNKLGDIPKEDAMAKYVDGLKEIVETMSFNGDVEDFLDSIGPFYEFVTLQGNEMNHIKEKIEEVTSSSGSSLSNSLVPSRDNSKENSPLKSVIQQGEVEEDEVSTSDKAEVSVETSTATYETKQSKNAKRYSQQNGNATMIKSKDASTPPPAPVHSYSQQNGFVKHSLENDNDDEEVLTVSSPYVHCKEDLEQDIDDGHSGHRRVRVTSSIETVASNATSGTESEKYYSGDSEPEIDERFASSLANSALETAGASGTQAIASTSGAIMLPKKPVASTLTKKLSKERISPKLSSTVAIPTTNADLLTQQTVERLNRDVDHILARLRILEAAYAANAEGAMRAPTNQAQRRKSRIFGDLSPQSIAFIVMWPFVVQFLIKLLRWWWRKRRSAIRYVTNSARSS